MNASRCALLFFTRVPLATCKRRIMTLEALSIACIGLPLEKGGIIFFKPPKFQANPLDSFRDMQVYVDLVYFPLFRRCRTPVKLTENMYLDVHSSKTTV